MPKLPDRVRTRILHDSQRRNWRAYDSFDEMVDRAADEELTGGFDPGDVCPDCRLARSRSGACGC